MEVLGTPKIAPLAVARTRPARKSLVRMSVRGDVAVLSIVNGPLNILTSAVRRELLNAIRELTGKAQFAAAILIGSGDTFVAGGDLRELDDEIDPPELPAVIEAIERCPIPFVAALQGAALGSGFELAMACDGRVCTATTTLGLPQTSLGGIPGAGGTQRLPRLVGRAAAAQIICSGRQIDAHEALELSLVDCIAEGDLLQCAIHNARQRAPFKRSIRNLPVPVEDEAAFQRAAALARGSGQVRPQVEAALRAVAASTAMPVESALALERQLFHQLRVSDAARALRYQFFARRRAAGAYPQTAAPEARKVGVVGAGPMGAQLAEWLLAAGVEVVLVDRDKRVLQKASRAIKSQRLAVGSELALLSGCDFVIESVSEDYEAKVGVFIALDALLGPDCLLATTTSSLDIDALASATGRAGRVCGLHFLPSASKASVVEVIRTSESSPATLSAAFALVRRIGRLPIVAGNAFGFIGHRLLTALRRQCAMIAGQGADPARIDEALRLFGFSVAPWVQVAAGAAADSQVVPSGSLDGDSIVQGVLLALANEAACILEDGVAATPGDIDVLLVDAYGFPAWEGGPGFWARQRDVDTVAQARDRLFEAGGPGMRRGNLKLLSAHAV